MKTRVGLILAGALVLLFPAIGAAQECREEFIFCPSGPACCCSSLKPPQCGLSADECYWYCNGVISANDPGSQPDLVAIFAGSTPSASCL